MPVFQVELRFDASLNVDEAHDAALELYSAVRGGAKEPDVLEKAFARSHRIFC